MKKDIEKAIDKLIYEDGINLSNKGFFVVNILEYSSDSAAYSISYILNKWDLNDLYFDYYLNYKDEIILLKFKDNFEQPKIYNFLKFNSYVRELAELKKDNILDNLGDLEGGFSTYSPIIYVVLIGKSRRYENRYLSVTPMGLSIYD